MSKKSASPDNDDSGLDDGGLKALRAEREQRKALESQLKELQRKLQSGDVLAYELQEAKNSLSKMQRERDAEIENLRQEIKRRDSAIAEANLTACFKEMASKYRLQPKFYDTILSANKSKFKFTSDGEKVVTKDGKTLSEWFDQEREEYPELFLAPTSAVGTGASPSANGPVKSRLVNRNDARAFLDNLEAIAKGDIVTGE